MKILDSWRQVFALILVLVLSSSALAQDTDSAAIDAIVSEALKAWKVPGAAVVIVKGDEVIYLKGHGLKQLEGGSPVTPDTLFAIASTSKAFTATAVAMLVDDGKMAWDDPVRKHVDFFRLADPLATEQVTIRDCLCHRTGLSRNDLLWYASPWDREEILRRAAHVKLSQSFRSRFQYQNIMYLAAGYAAGRAAQTSWEDVVRKRIFEPLGMNGANFSSKDAEKASDRATPHRQAPGGKIETIPWRNFDNVGPAGTINAGVRDLSKWLRFQLGDGVFEGKRLLAAKQLAETHTPQMVIDMDGPTGVPSFSKAMNPDTNMMCYGLGWVIQDYRGHAVISHGGSIDGFRTQVALVPKAKFGMAIVSNLGRTQFPESVRNSLVNHLLGLSKKDWNAHYLEQLRKVEADSRKRIAERLAKRQKDTKPSRDLPSYAGAYSDPAYGVARISLEEGNLVLSWSSFNVRLEHFHFDTFDVKDPKIERDSPIANQQVTFNLGPDGEVASMNCLEQEFRRVKSEKKPMGATTSGQR